MAAYLQCVGRANESNQQGLLFFRVLMFDVTFAWSDVIVQFA
jgi:hypothetical protein